MVFTHTVSEVHAALKNEALSSDGQFRCVTISYDRLPAVKSLIDDILDHLAHVALALFPNWYGDVICFPEIDASLSGFDSLLGDQASHDESLEVDPARSRADSALVLCSGFQEFTVVTQIL